MTDNEITALLESRSEKGLSELQKKFTRLIMKITRGLLSSQTDAEECANDTLLAVWNAIPPDKPDNLAAYVAKIARCKTINRLRYNKSPIRNSELLTELDECIPSNSSVEQQAELNELSEALNEWLRSLPEKQQRLFTLRYFFNYGVKEAAKACGMSTTAATTALMRLREGLRKHLSERGIYHG